MAQPDREQKARKKHVLSSKGHVLQGNISRIIGSEWPLTLSRPSFHVSCPHSNVAILFLIFTNYFGELTTEAGRMFFNLMARGGMNSTNLY